jgi:hypothetical protein
MKKSMQKKSRLTPAFTRKTGARMAKILQTPPFGRQTGVFLRHPYLFFGSPDEVEPSCEHKESVFMVER